MKVPPATLAPAIGSQHAAYTANQLKAYKAGTRSETEVVEMMIGREYSHIFPPKPTAPVAEGVARYVRKSVPL